MTAILAIESSTLTASVSLLVDGEIVYERDSGVNSHSEILLALVDEALQKAALRIEDLQTIAIGQGPGSFTGLRIGMATVKGLCFACNLPLTPVSSLAALALDALVHCSSNSIVLSVLDARRGEIFTGAFAADDSGPNRLLSEGQEKVMKPEELSMYAINLGSPIVLCGDGSHKYREAVSGIGQILDESRQTPSASAVAKLAQHLPSTKVLAEAAPSYVRLPEAEIKFPDGNTGGTFSFPTK